MGVLADGMMRGMAGGVVRVLMVMQMSEIVEGEIG